MFSNLENFLSAKDEFKEAEKVAPKPSFSAANDSWLDTSDPCVKSETENDGAGKEDDGKESSYVPVKGQKMAAKRLKQIQDSLAKGLVDTEKIEKRMNQQKTAKNAQTKKSPPKRAQLAQRAQRTGRRNRLRGTHVFVQMDSDSDLDSDLDAPIATNATTHPVRRAPPHDPNIIVFDCDDEFASGPAMNFTRNLAGADVVSVEQSQEMKVSVRINNKIEQFQMSPYQKLSALINQISQKKNVPSNHIVMMLKKKTVSEFETLNSIGYVQGLVITTLISNTIGKSKNAADAAEQDNADKLEIKIQSDGRKRPFITYIKPTDQLMVLAFACADEFKCDIDKVAIEFDGEFVNFKQTAEHLALEGGEVMDFFQKK